MKHVRRRLREVEHRVPMTADAPLSEAGRAVVAHQVKTLLDALDREHGRHDADAVHDARVSIRRLRASFEILGGDVYDHTGARYLRRSLGRLGRALGEVRDADVLIATLEAPGQPCEPALVAAERKRRKRARRELARLLRRRGTTRALDRLCRFAVTPGRGVRDGMAAQRAPWRVCDHARSLLWRRYEAVHAYAPVSERTAVETLHRLRVELKRLRYAIDLFAGALEGREELEAELASAQDHLGALHDADIAVDRDARTGHTAAAQLIEKRERLQREAPRALEAVLGASFRQRLAGATAAL